MFPLYTDRTPAQPTGVDTEREFFVTVDYRTHGGSPSSWSGYLTATWDTVHEVGQAKARKARRGLYKIDGGRAVLATMAQA